MSRIILFSQPEPGSMKKVAKRIFDKSLGKIIFGYMPSEGYNKKAKKYIPYWRNLARKHNAKFVIIDNISRQPGKEAKKIKVLNSLMISGGNTFILLNNLRKSGLDKKIINFAKRKNVVLSGMSAGAAVMAPTIRIVSEKWTFGSDENIVGLKNFSGLNIVDFEVLPHFESSDKKHLQKYMKKNNVKVIPISNSDFIEISSMRHPEGEE